MEFPAFKSLVYLSDNGLQCSQSGSYKCIHSGDQHKIRHSNRDYWNTHRYLESKYVNQRTSVIINVYLKVKRVSMILFVFFVFFALNLLNRVLLLIYFK